MASRSTPGGERLERAGAVTALGRGSRGGRATGAWDERGHGRRGARPVAPNPQRLRARRAAAWRRRRLVLLLMSPWIVGFCVFFVYPLVTTVLLSFTHYDLLSSPRWVGLANYELPVQHRQAGLARGLQHALVRRDRDAAAGVVRVRGRDRDHPRPAGVGHLPHDLLPADAGPPVAATLAFVYLFNPATGPVNEILGSSARRPAVVQAPELGEAVAGAARDVGHRRPHDHLPGGLLDVPKHLYEAAELDGADAWQRFRYITLPTISPVIMFAVVIAVIEALQYFTQA